MHSSFKMIIATIGIFFVATCCYSQGATPNFKTYTNSKYGFTFQYPSNWVVDADSDIIVAENITSRNVHFIDPASKTFLLINYSVVKGSEIYNFYVANFDPVRNKHITVDGDEAIQITTTDNKNGKGRLLNKKDQAKEINVEFMDKNKTGAFELKFRAQLNSNLAGEIKKFDHLVHSFKRLR